MSRFLLLTLALAVSFASSELAAEVPRELSSDDDYGYDDESGKGGKGGMMSGKGGKGGKGGMMSGKGYYEEPEETYFPAPTSPPIEPCVCVEVCDESEMDDDSGKGGMMSGMMSGKGKGERQLMMGKGGKGYDDDYTAEPVCHEECTGDCYPEPPALECCEYESVCEEEPEEGKGKGGMMSGGMMSGKGDRQLMMGKGGKGYDDDSSPVCEDVCVKYCPPAEPIYTFTPGDGDMCYDTASYTTGDDCVCNCECCMDESEYPEEEEDYGKGKGGMMSGKGGMMGGKGDRQLMMGKGGMMMGGKGYYEEPDASFSCACGCACPESVPVPEPSPSPSGKGMMGMMSGKGGKGGKGSGKGSGEGKGSSGDYL